MKRYYFHKIKGVPIFTWIFLGVQSVIFFLNTLLPEIIPTFIPQHFFSYFGVMSRESIVVNHEYWRFITPIFFHFGFSHYALNSVVLYFMGLQIEKIYGSFRFFFLYFFSGFMGNVASFALNEDGIISAGASTSLFGLFGAFLILGLHFKKNPYIHTMARQFLLFVVLSIFFGLFDQRIDLWGHIGGLIGGVLLGNVLALPQPNEKYSVHIRFLSLIVFAFFVIICVVYGFNK